MLYPLSSPSEVVQLNDRCLVEFSVILRLVTAAGTGKVGPESETEICHTPLTQPRPQAHRDTLHSHSRHTVSAFISTSWRPQSREN